MRRRRRAFNSRTPGRWAATASSCSSTSPLPCDAIGNVTPPPNSATTRAADERELALEQHRAELTAYAYRMLGSAFEAEDAVQETLVRAWRNLDRFEGRSSVRSS